MRCCSVMMDLVCLEQQPKLPLVAVYCIPVPSYLSYTANRGRGRYLLSGFKRLDVLPTLPLRLPQPMHRVRLATNLLSRR